MKTPFITYLVLTHNEGKQLKSLFELLSKYMINDECIILDDFSDDIDTISVLDEYKQNKSFKLYQHKLDKDYSAHRNEAFQYCNGKYVFSIDGDEVPKVIV